MNEYFHGELTNERFPTINGFVPVILPLRLALLSGFHRMVGDGCHPVCFRKLMLRNCYEFATRMLRVYEQPPAERLELPNTMPLQRRTHYSR